jgi:hypothetical protein
MAITAVATPATLSWADFVVVPTQIVDPNDGSLVDAVTRFNFNIPDLAPRTVNGQVAMADPNVITIAPNSRVFSGVAQTAALLSHEQFHYDVGFVVARSLGRHLAALRARDVATLRVLFADAARLHIDVRVRLLQNRYDIDTRHGTNAHFQKIWKDRMRHCLAHARADHLGGFWL